MVDTGGCCGRCCERFCLSHSPVELRRRLRLKELGETFTDSEDYELVCEMLIYLGKSALNGNGRFDSVESHWYTCKYFNPKTRLCQIYEKRPKMCRVHGDVTYNPCLYEGCKKGKPTMGKTFDGPELCKAEHPVKAREERRSIADLKAAIRTLELKLEKAQDEIQSKDEKVSKLHLQIYMLEREKAAWVDKALDLIAANRADEPMLRRKVEAVLVKAK